MIQPKQIFSFEAEQHAEGHDYHGRSENGVDLGNDLRVMPNAIDSFSADRIVRVQRCIRFLGA